MSERAEVARKLAAVRNNLELVALCRLEALVSSELS
ncbi:MAG: hypothetical protein RL033_6922 [Pseudomonadota bacterium]|jgi:hypothetical protein